MEPYKKLYLANNLDALELLACRTPLKDCKDWNMLKRLFDEASRNYLDQELQFIYYYRYKRLYEQFLNKGSDDFIQIRFENEYKKVLAKLDELGVNLGLRYMGQTSVDLEEKAQPTSSPVPKKKKKIFSDEFISCSELYSALKKKCNVLVVDARPDYDFEKSDMLALNCINVPEQIITSGLSANTLGQKLSGNAQKLWNLRDSFDAIVLFDWKTSSEHLTQSKLYNLKSAIVDWDMNRNYSEPPVILNGGYLEFLQVYPTMCRNPHVLLTHKNDELDELLDLDNIVYPKEVDNKVPVLGLSNNVTIEEKRAEIVEKPPSRESLILEDKELTIKRQEIIAELLKASEKWKVLHKSCNYDGSERNVELRNELNLVDKLINSLEHRLCECDNLKDNVKQKFDLFAKFDPNQEHIKSNDIKEILDIEEDGSEKLKILDAIAEERCKALEEARASKPKPDENKPKYNQEHGKLLETDRPVINRATKPRGGSLTIISKAMADPIENLSPGRVGLRNIKNTCYMNTIIQCLRNIPCIMHLFCDGTYVSHNHIRTPPAIIYEIAYVVRYLWSNVVKYVEPFEFYKKVCKLEASYSLGNHEDCMEFFLFLLNLLCEDCYYDAATPLVMTPKQKAWYNQFQGRRSVFIDFFYHQVRIYQICPVCQNATYKFEIESTFMLSVPENDFYLERLMAEYMADFVIPEYRCAKCKKPVTNKKEICFQPKVVVIVLKRYKQVVINGMVTIKKIDSRGSFPKNNFKIGNEFYHLNSIVMHSGDMNHGHYTAVCATSQGWLEFNDEHVRSININSEEVKTKACAFFYSVDTVKI